MTFLFYLNTFFTGINVALYVASGDATMLVFAAINFVAAILCGQASAAIEEEKDDE